ncbi:restriction endonuclease subunit S [Methylobacterium sp. WL18]|uniref:restriction endonuclease subunit S n=1 Tax=Methylobacterium sp. WL18 TaxID=2603897 RepID=UPI0011CCB883|nr:restriction endonuclease subunit S [Methylobacterium sp. WL18]TXN74888.1 restriction endonuclease subunit S [Methylobacterium sp. WL18]
MNAERLLAHYERVADAPDAMARLRRFILDLAVRGKLVPQNAADEPAPELLERVEHERVDQADLPKGWHRAKVGTLLSFQYGKGLKSSERGNQGRVPVFGSNGVVGFTIEALASCPSIIVGRKGSAGALNLCNGPSWTTDVAYYVEPPSYFSIKFLLHALASLDLARLGKGVKPGLSRSDAYELVLCVPPLAEQLRIVAKVDELMTLCNEIEEAHTSREAVRDQLTTASLARLDTPNPETFQADARCVLDALPALTTRASQIKAVRQTLLNLAVRGKLVAQDPNNETVSELLKQIAADKAERAVSARDRRATQIKPLVADVVPFPLPSNWAWVSFGDIMISRDGERIPVSREEREQRAKVYDYYGASGVIDKIDSFIFDKPLLLIGEDGANLVNRSTPIAFIARGKYWVNNHAHVLDGLSEAFLRYVELFINAIDLKPYVTGAAQPKMNQAKMNSIPIALPPLAEQHRIVAKVDELMALCDRLEGCLRAGDEARSRLLEALVSEALTPNDSAELMVAAE